MCSFAYSIAKASRTRGSDTCRRLSIAIRRRATASCTAQLAPHAATTPSRSGDSTGLAAVGARASRRRERRCAGVRAYPPQWGLGPHDAGMRELAIAAGEQGMALLLTVRFEDLRQRHSMDNAGDLSAAAIRALARAGESVRLVVTAAGREMIEEVHWGLTPEEQQRVCWDISWIWGPPEDHLAKLFRTIGAARFVFGTHWPLRLTQNPSANLDLLPDDLLGHRSPIRERFAERRAAAQTCRANDFGALRLR